MGKGDLATNYTNFTNSGNERISANLKIIRVNKICEIRVICGLFSRLCNFDSSNRPKAVLRNVKRIYKRNGILADLPAQLAH
jgi:hypothetical protein